MKVPTKVGFIKQNQDQIAYLEYNDVEEFCIRQIVENKKESEFKDSLLTPFDYVMQKMHYIFVNPLFYNDKYLICKDNNYYEISKLKVEDTCDSNLDKTLYENILITFSDLQDDQIFMLAITDETINKRDFYEDGIDGFVTPDANFLVKDNAYRHSALATTLCHRELVRNRNYVENYYENWNASIHYPEMFLVKKHNFIEIDTGNNINIIIFNEKTITEKQKELIQRLSKEEGRITDKETSQDICCLIVEKQNTITGLKK